MQADLGKVVIVAALDGDYRRQPFPSVMELIPCAEQLQKLSAVCCNHSVIRVH